MMNLFVFLEKLELLAFFSAFPLYYYLVNVVASEFSFQKKWILALPSSITLVYGIITLLYIGMKVNQMFEIHLFKLEFNNTITYFKIWSSLGVLFFLPAMKVKSKWALFHSIPFTLWIVIDFILFYRSQVSRDIINNEMRLYFTSLLLLIFVTLVVSFFTNFSFKKTKK